MNLTTRTTKHALVFSTKLIANLAIAFVMIFSPFAPLLPTVQKAHAIPGGIHATVDRMTVSGPLQDQVAEIYIECNDSTYVDVGATDSGGSLNVYPSDDDLAAAGCSNGDTIYGKAVADGYVTHTVSSTVIGTYAPLNFTGDDSLLPQLEVLVSDNGYGPIEGANVTFGGMGSNSSGGNEFLFPYTGTNSVSATADGYLDSSDPALNSVALTPDAQTIIRIQGDVENGGSISGGGDFTVRGLVGAIRGCMDPSANDYVPEANQDDGSCTYDGGGGGGGGGPTLPTVVISHTIGALAQTGALASASVTDAGGGTISAEGFVYDTSTHHDADPSLYAVTVSADPSNASYQDAFESLSCNTTYYYRAWATNETGTSTSDEASFKTPGCDATVGLNNAGLVAHWRLDGDVSDDSAGGNNGTINGGLDVPSFQTETPATTTFTNSYSLLTSTNSEIDVPDATNLNFTGSFSIAFWLKPTVWNDGGTHGVITKIDSGAGAHGFAIENDTAAGSQITFFANGSHGGNASGLNANIDIGQWQHLAVVYDAGEKTLAWYKNGSLTGKYNGVDLGDLTNNHQLELLHSEISGGGYYQGGLDDVRMYNTALTGAQVAQLGQGYQLAAFTGGSGLSDSPYQIASCDDLAAVNNKLDANYILTADLSCGGYNTLIMIGTADHPFTGDFNGNGHRIIENIQSDIDVGLFRVANGAHIHNLKISGVVHGQTNVGALVGIAEGETTLSNIESTADVDVTAEFGGGLVGVLDASIIQNSYETGAVNGGPSNDESSAAYVGGLAGKITGSEAQIASSYATGNVTDNAFAGGLVAQGTDYGSISDSFATGAIDTSISAGGIIGVTQGGENAVLLSDDFDATGATYCAGDNPSVSGCTQVSASSLQSTKSGTPFNTNWDFNSVWATSDTYPVLRSIDGGGNQGPDVTITTPENSSSVTNWAPDISWGDATSCYYQFDGTDSYVAMGSCNNSIPAPDTTGEHILNIEASNGVATTTASADFGYTLPTQISSCADIENITTSGDLSSSYVLTRSLDCTADGNDIIIGSSDAPFTGSFDGTGHRITVDISRSDDYTGLFSKLNGATVSNLWIDGSITGGNDTGALAGQAILGAIISKIKSTANVTSVSGTAIGGIVGSLSNSNYINDSYATGIVSGYDTVGGIAGEANASVVQRSYFSGTASSTVDNVGGIAGTFNNSALHNNFSTGSVIAGGINAGGIVGSDITGTDFSDNQWDSTASGQTNCIGAGFTLGSFSGCEDQNPDGSGSNFFKGTSSNVPFPAWDFDTVWQTNTSALPTLQEFAGVPRDIVVNTLLDDGNGSCAGGGECTFRDAISTAGEGDEVTFQRGLTGTITLTKSAEIDINNDISILGPGQDQLAIDFNNDVETWISIGNTFGTTTVSGLTFKNCENTDLDIASSFDSAALVISDSTFKDNSVFPSVEAFYNGSLTVTNSTFLNNTVNTDNGGAIYSGTAQGITIASSTFDGNSFDNGENPISDTTHGGGAIAYVGAGNLTIASSTFNNNSSYNGGAILVDQVNNLTIATSTFTNNHSAYWVGAISAQQIFGGVFINASTFSGNHADNAGYGTVYLEADPALITGSTFSDNTVTDNLNGSGGGAIYNDGYLGLVNDTFSGNTVNGSSTPNGGALDNFGSAEITNTTFANDTVSDGGAGGEIFNNDGIGATTEIINSILAGGTPGNCGGTITSNGNNIDSGSSCNFGIENDLSNTDPLFAEAGLANYGGPVKTIAIQPSSPAIDSANGMAAPEIDARGVARPQDGNNDGDAYADVGAFEYVYNEDEGGGVPSVPNVSISYPTASSTITDWNAITDWSTSNAEQCYYQYDGEDSEGWLPVETCNNSDTIPAPATPGVHTLYIKGTNDTGSGVASTTFTYITDSNGGHQDYNWSDKSLPDDGPYNHVVVSADGSTIALTTFGGYVYVSHDDGSSWTQAVEAGTTQWNGISISADGEHIVAGGANHGLWHSDDGGASWNLEGGGLDPGAYYMAVTMSDDGSRIVAVDNNGTLWISNNSGSSWTQNTTFNGHLMDQIASSGDGQYLELGIDDYWVGGGPLYTSADYGATWTAVSGLGDEQWVDVAVSRNGQYMLAVDNGGDILFSNNYGSGYGGINDGSPGKSVAVTGNGQTMFGSSNGQMRSSADFGNSWNAQDGPGQSASMSTSANGSTAVAVSGGSLYVGHPSEAGSGTTGDPYQISSCSQLEQINNNLSASYVLENDLDCHTDGNTVMLGSDGSPFTGHLDGAGHKVTIALTDDGDEIGLFRKTSSAVISNLWVAGTINALDFHEQTGGLVGLAINDTVLTSIASTVHVVTGDGESYIIGGIAGEFDNSLLQDSYFKGTVFGNDEVGGLVGKLVTSTIARSYNIGSVTSDHWHNPVGEISGYTSADSNLVNNFAAGVITEPNGFFIGDLVGGMNSNIQNNFWDANTTGVSNCADTASGSTEGQCQEVNGDGNAPDFFKGNDTSPPFTTDWDFTNVWNTVDGWYPSLRHVANDETAPGVGNKTYYYVKWEITQLKGVTDDGGSTCPGGCVQASEFQLTEDGAPVAWPSGTVATNPGGDNPGDQTPDKLIDGDTTTKWLDHNFDAGMTASGRSSVVIHAGSSQSVTFNGYHYATGDDWTERDPVSWNLYGSVDGTHWVLLDTRTNQTITDDRDATTTEFSSFTPAFASGTGTVTDPFLVSTCGDLEAINSNLNKAYLLTTDLDCHLDGAAATIGNGAAAFTGNFNGAGHSVTVNINTDDSAAGLFEYASNATIRNVNVTGSVSGGNQVGGLIGRMDNSIITQVSSTANASTFSGNDVGGLIGYSDGGTVTDSYASSTVSGNDYVGGLIGNINSTSLLNTYAAGTVTGNSALGGLIGGGATTPHSVVNSFAAGTVTLTGGGDAGGLSGNITDTDTYLNSSYSMGNTGQSACNGGGDVTGCVGEFTDGADVHFYSKTNAPLSSWDFGGYVWQENMGTFPTFVSPYVAAPFITTGTTTDVATSPTTQQVTFGGTIVSLGDTPGIYDRGFQYGTTTDYASSTDEGVDGVFTAGDFSLQVNDLMCNTTYHYRAFTTDNFGTIYGADETVTTNPCETITINSPVDGTTITQGEWNPSVEWSDAFVTCEYAYDENSYATMGSCSATIPAPETSGAHTLHLRGTDGSANQLTASTDFTYLSQNTFDGLGSGTADDPYQITTCVELQEMSIDDGNDDFKLMNNIDCSDTENWNDGKGFGIFGFGGVLNGQGHSIENLYMNYPNQESAGLFSYFGGIVYDLTMDGGSIAGGSFAGSVVGESYGGLVAGVTSNADVEVVNPEEFPGAGGLVGFEEDSTITQSSFAGTVGSYGMSIAGGLVGLAVSGLDMEDSFASSTVSAFGTGGLVGYVFSDYDGVTIAHSYAAGVEYGAAFDGGLIGGGTEQYGPSNASTTINSSFSVATLIPMGDGSEVGGIFGYLNVTHPSFNSAYFDQTASDGGLCVGYNNLLDVAAPSGADGCTAINTDGTDGSHYMSTSSPDVAPLGDFNFDSIWQEVDGELPQLQVNTYGSSSAPTDLTIGALDGLSIPFSWTAPADTRGLPVLSYEYFLEPQGAGLNYGDDGTLSGTMDGDATSTRLHNVELLSYNSSYDLRIRTHTALGYSAWTDPVTVTFGDTPTHQITSCEDLVALGNDPYVYADNIELENDINCSGVDNFAPLGSSWVGYFMGDFNGQGNAINNLTINEPDTQYVGLFSLLANASVENVHLGTVDGGTGSISGENYVGGITGDAEDSSIDNVTSTLDVTGGTDGGGYYIGGLTGEFNAVGTGEEISSSTVTANVTGDSYLGGLVGYLGGEDSDSNGVTINMQGDSYAGTISGNPEGDGANGGLIGYVDMNPSSDSNTTNFLSLSDSHSSGSVSGSGYVGGLIGYIFDGAEDSASLATSFSRVYSSSAISGQWYLGGLIGYHDVANYGSGSVTDNMSESYASGNITSTDGAYLGGLEGYVYLEPFDTGLSGSITDSYASGSIHANGSDGLPAWVGGLMGGAGGWTIDRTYATGQVMAQEGAGGLIGSIDSGTVSNSFSTGAVSGLYGSTAYIGGFIGQNNDASLVNDYYDADESLQGSGNCVNGAAADGCTPVSGDVTHFINTSSVQPFISGDPIWNFDMIWQTASGKYPQLQRVAENVPASFSDVSPPEVTPIGPSQVIVYEGETYHDLGATARDNVDGDLTSSIETDNEVDTSTPGTYYVTYSVSDSSENTGSVIRDVIVKDLSDSQALINTNQSTYIYVPASISNGTVDLSAFATDETHATIPNSITIFATTTSGVAQVNIPGAITITSSVPWAGTLNLPQPVDVTVPPSDGSHTTAIASEIEIGSTTSSMTFDRGVRIDFPGMAGKLVSWTTGDGFTSVTARCDADTQEAGDALGAAGDCKLDVGGDLVVWTKHFTTFALYSESTVSAPPSENHGGGGGGSGYSGGRTVSAAQSTTAQSASVTSSVRDLKVGAQGADVKALQLFLITQNTGSAARALAKVTATGYFSALTRNALVEYQKAHGIKPASGYFGAITQTQMKASGAKGLWW